jgi:internalin A
MRSSRLNARKVRKVAAEESPEVEQQSLTELIEENRRTQNIELGLWNQNKEYSEVPKEVFELTHLEKLTLEEFELESIPSGIYRLTSLKELRIIDSKLKEFPTELKELDNLTDLTFSSSEIVEVSAEAITWEKLRYLNISGCSKLINISYLPPNLTYIHIGSTPLKSIPPAVFALKHLGKLVATGLGLNHVPLDILKLTTLRALFLGRNNLTDLPAELSTLQNISELWLYENKFKEFPSVISSFKNLQSLNLNKNKLSDIPDTFSNLENLDSLDLSSNNFTFIPNAVFKLENLRSLNLLGISYTKNDAVNKITYIPFDFTKLKNLEQIRLEGNPIENVPHEIIAQGAEAIRSYLVQLENQDHDYLFEAKLLILGEPGAGKTSLTWKLNDPHCALPEEEDSTKGIDVQQYHFPVSYTEFPDAISQGQERNFCLNIWDFGGQEIYKATHRFFLSNRALYILVSDTRKEDTDFNYWLHIVEMFGGKSPLLIVLNEKLGRVRAIDTVGLSGRFTNINQVLEVDLAASNTQRLETIKSFVKLLAVRLSHVGSRVPANWTAVREAIVADSRDIISVHEYISLCKAYGIDSPTDALVLSQYFHDIGVFLHFQKDPILKHSLFLKPTWATNAVYKVLDHELLIQQNGRFSKEDAAAIWHEEEYLFVRDELLRLMQNFLLTYEVSETEGYIVPDKLPANTPSYKWDNLNNLTFIFEYESFMPKGLLTQFIVRMHRHITDHNLVWRKGVILSRQETLAEIIETYDSRTIRIRISGKHKRDFMTLVVDQIEDINKQYKLKIKRLIPCTCHLCLTQTPYFYNFRNLQDRIDRGQPTVECGESYINVNVKSLVDEVYNGQLLAENGTAELAAIRELTNAKTMADKYVDNKIFISYAHADDAYLKRLLVHFKTLKHEGVELDVWSDKKLKSGSKWKKEIEQAMHECSVCILLVSADFLASDFIMKVELPALLKGAEKRGVDIIPVIVSPCRYTQNPHLKDFQAQNDPKKPLSKLTVSQREEEYLRILTRVEELLLPF